MFLIHTSREHAEVVARAVVGACRLDGWQSPMQPQLLHTLFNRLLGQDLDFEKIEPLLLQSLWDPPTKRLAVS
ncbi:MAG TPA: hypothetical protein VEG60_06785 [Candidatus Binatia bacterium]|nr:hypothetical protein [Candidatus Binatia bacterium]